MKKHSESSISPAEFEEKKKQKEKVLYNEVSDHIFKIIVQYAQERLNDSSYTLTLDRGNEYGKIIEEKLNKSLDKFKINNGIVYLFQYFEEEKFSEFDMHAVFQAIGYEIGASIHKNFKVERREAGKIGNIPQVFLGFASKTIDLAQAATGSDIGRGVKETVEAMQNDPKLRPLRIEGLEKITDEDFERFITDNSVILEAIQSQKQLEKMMEGKVPVNSEFLNAEKKFNYQALAKKTQDVQSALMKNFGKKTEFSETYEKTIEEFAIGHRSVWYAKYAQGIDDILSNLAQTIESRSLQGTPKSKAVTVSNTIPFLNLGAASSSSSSPAFKASDDTIEEELSSSDEEVSPLSEDKVNHLDSSSLGDNPSSLARSHIATLEQQRAVEGLEDKKENAVENNILADLSHADKVEESKKKKKKKGNSR